MTPHHSTDESLAEGLRAGRRDAFERLYDEQHATIYNLCARILGNREEAKDVTQETFITAFSNPPAADPSLKLRAWLYRVATNACFNQLRSRNRSGGGDALVEQVAAPVDEFARAETVAAVEQTLGQLNERYRTALVLKDLHGLPPEEIAQVMEISRPNADVLVHRARASFKTAFAKLDGEVSAPASLGLVLLPLTVPAPLHVMPPLPHPLPVHPIPPHLAHLAQQPHTGGLLNKLATATTAKIGIGAAAVTLAVGGGVLAVRDVERSHRSHGSGAPTQPAAASLTAFAPASSSLRHHAHSVGHDAAEHSHDAAHDSMHQSADHSGETAQHDGTTEHAGDHSTTTTGTHDSGSMSTSTDTTDHSTSTTGTHDSPSTTGDGDHSSGE